MKRKNHKNHNRCSFMIDATTTSADWGFKPVPNKGGATTNFEIPEWMFDKELELMKKNGGVAVA